MKSTANQTSKSNNQSVFAYGWDEAWGLLSMLLAYLAICAILLSTLSLFATPVQAVTAMATLACGR